MSMERNDMCQLDAMYRVKKHAPNGYNITAGAMTPNVGKMFDVHRDTGTEEGRHMSARSM
jgi:hypothetical protein